MDNRGVLRWHVACDESGTGGARYYGFGSLWMKYQRRGDFARLIKELRDRHNFHDEIKWQKANNKRNLDFHLELIELFFKRQWLAFHCIIVNKSDVDKSFHNGDYDLARRKHFTKLLDNKIKAVLKAQSRKPCEFRISVDPIASRYSKADEAVENILSNIHCDKRVAEIKVKTEDSKDSVQIQICDFFLGAVMAAWQKKSDSTVKKKIQETIAEYLGWPDLEADTWGTERKFNIWYFHDTRRQSRSVTTRDVVLKHPLPERGHIKPTATKA